MTRDTQPTIGVVSCTYGAPMGRADWLPCNAEPRTVRVFRVHISVQGYDQGGAYWGTGKPLFCATDSGNYREFARATNRAAAIAALNIDPTLLRIRS